MSALARLRWRIRTRRTWTYSPVPLTASECDALAGLERALADRAATRRAAGAERDAERSARSGGAR